MGAYLLRASMSEHGIFTSREAAAAGISWAALRKEIASGRVRKIDRDTYTRAPAREDAREAHRELVAGAVHRYRGRVVAAEHSALVVHRLPTFEADLSRASLLWCNDASSQFRQQLDIRRTKFDLPKTLVDDIPVVVEAVAFLQVAARQGTLAAVVAGDAMLHRESTSIAELEEVCRRFASYPGQRVAAKAIARLDARTESPQESVLRIVAGDAGIVLEPQFEVYDGDELIARADFRIEGSRALVECDGRIKYAGTGDGGPDVLWAEKQREDRIRRLKWGVERVINADFATPRALLHRLRRAAADHPDALSPS